MPKAPNILVYVVDEQLAVRERLCKQLAAMECASEDFERGEACLAAMARRLPDLVVMALNLPGRPGDECCRVMKDDRRLAGIPVVLSSAGDGAPEVLRSWRAGADDLLHKPIDARQLASKIEAVRSAALAGSTPAAAAPAVPRILFVDDTCFFRSVLGGALEHSGFHVLYARGGAEALELVDYQGGAIDAVISEVRLPGLDGVSLARQLRTRPGFEQRPILLLSGFPPSEEQAAEAMRVTSSAVLVKREIPVESILARVQMALHRVDEDLRAAERVPFFSVAEFRRAGEPEWLSGFVHGVSSTGIFVRSMTPLPSGSPVELRVRFTFRNSPRAAMGSVAWSNGYAVRTSWSYPVGMGIHFTCLDAEDRDAVDRLASQGKAA